MSDRMHWSLAGKTDAELLRELQVENFAMAHTQQTQAERARSVVRCNQIMQARTTLRRDARHAKFRERMHRIAMKRQPNNTEIA